MTVRAVPSTNAIANDSAVSSSVTPIPSMKRHANGSREFMGPSGSAFDGGHLRLAERAFQVLRVELVPGAVLDRLFELGVDPVAEYGVFLRYTDAIRLLSERLADNAELVRLTLGFAGECRAVVDIRIEAPVGYAFHARRRIVERDEFGLRREFLHIVFNGRAVQHAGRLAVEIGHAFDRRIGAARQDV